VRKATVDGMAMPALKVVVWTVGMGGLAAAEEVAEAAASVVDVRAAEEVAEGTDEYVPNAV
jgi:hypothetical protein